MGEPFTVEVPHPLEVTDERGHWWAELAGHRLRLSNLDKVFWPEEGYTKGDLLNYYANVAELMLPHLRDRPLTMKRMPDGASGPHFYEKNAPSHTPDWMPRCPVDSDESEGGRIYYLMVNDLAGLLFVANLGCIEFHPLHSRCPTIDLPDYLFFDLDPFDASFEDVLVVARHVRVALDALGLPSYPKTSGATGMQIYVPIAHGPSYGEVRAFVAAVGRAILAVDRQRVTMEWEIRKRTGKTFIDHNMNRRGANIAAVYSVRPEAGATVSTPLTWDEIEAGDVRPSDFTIANVHERLADAGDLFAGMLTSPVDVREALDRMGVEVDDDRDERLGAYRGKRTFEATPEPAPGATETTGDRFVIQKHNATRLHYDLRLERDGTLASWALPKGLPVHVGERHLAVQTEDHPLEYLDFEAVIPPGNYGAGEMRIFDTGTYEALEWEDGKVTFRLEGSRHRGEWHLFRTRQGWLVTLSKASANLQPADPPNWRPMLAERHDASFDDDEWLFEPKLDGVRTLAYVTPAGTKLVSRTGRDQTAQYPELNNVAMWCNALQAVIDGEIAAHDERGVPRFERIQQRMNLSGEREIDQIRRTIPVTMYAFDLLWLDGEDLTRRHIEERREALEEIVTECDRVKLTVVVPRRGNALFEQAKTMGFEGIVGKRAGSRYRPGERSRDWRKVKAVDRLDCVVVGWTQGDGGRAPYFGALLLGAYDGDELRWIGQVGTGFDDRLLKQVRQQVEAVESETSPIDDPELTKDTRLRWCRPELVCEVEYLEVTKAGKLRAPSFKGMRIDKDPQECVLP